MRPVKLRRREVVALAAWGSRVILWLLLIACEPPATPLSAVVFVDAPVSSYAFCDPGYAVIEGVPASAPIVSAEFCAAESCWSSTYERAGDVVAVTCFAGEGNPLGRLVWLEYREVWVEVP